VASVTVHCPHCQSDEVCRYGLTPSGHQRFLCKLCRRVFQLSFIYEARKPDVQGKIVDMAFNGAGVRDTARTLKIGINTVFGL
jgi:transposase-like protein